MELFRCALENGGLIDLGWMGNKYTWSNGHGDETFIKERLDRGVASKGWLASFSEVEVETIVVWCSDHMTILLIC